MLKVDNEIKLLEWIIFWNKNETERRRGRAMAFGRMTLSRMTFIGMTLNRIKLSRMITIRTKHSRVTLS